MLRPLSLSFRMEGEEGVALDQARGRIVLIAFTFILLYVIVVIRLFDLTILQGELKAYGNTQIAQAETEEQIEAGAQVPRRDIVDRNGVLLAISVKTASLYADPALIMNAQEAAQGLARIFPDLTEQDLESKLRSPGRFVWIRRNLTPEEQAKVLELGQPGLAFEEEQRRLFPQGRLASHLIGYTNIDGRGLSGLEQSLEPQLRDHQSDAPIELTLDIRLQHILRREIQAQINAFSAKGGAGLILNVKTGEVLAAVSLPDFDPHAPANAAANQKFNRFSLGVYEMGSTFKIFSTAAFLEKTKKSLGYQLDARAPVRIGGYTISDFHPENKIMTIPEVFMHSSNIGTAHMAMEMGAETLKNFYERLGLLRPLECDLNEVGTPLIPTPWRETNVITASYGHGIAVTPLQLAVAAATIVNDGVQVKPVFKVSEKTNTKAYERVISSDTSKKIRELLRLVVTKGTGEKAEVPGFLVGGKTGTAEKIEGKKYNTKSLLSSFIGFFPMSDPEYEVFVMVDEPQGTKASYGYATGGWVAAPAVARTIQSMTQILALSPPSASTPDPAEALTRYLPVEFQKPRSPLALVEEVP